MEVQLGCKGTKLDLHGIKLQAHEDRNGTELFGAVAVLALTCGTEMGPNWDRIGTEMGPNCGPKCTSLKMIHFL